MKGIRLKELRNEKKLNQDELANILGISPSAVGMYERNQREPDDEMKFKIANFFNVSVAYLMGETDKRNTTISHDNEFIAFYEGYKDLEDEDKEVIQATINALKKKKKK